MYSISSFNDNNHAKFTADKKERHIKNQNLAKNEHKVILDEYEEKIYLPKNWYSNYTYFIGLYNKFGYGFEENLEILFYKTSIAEVHRRGDKSLSITCFYESIQGDNKVYIYRKNDESGYYINKNGGATLINYSDFSELHRRYKIIGACSVLDFNQFKPISFNFDMNIIYIEGENTVFTFDQMGLLKGYDMTNGVYKYDIISFSEFIKKQKYYVDDNEKKIFNSYTNVTNKYQSILDEVKKSYYYLDSGSVEVLCENNEKYQFPNYLFPLLNNCPFNCTTITIMKTRTPNPIEKAILFKVVKIIEYMVHKPNINFIDLLKNNEIIELDKIGFCADYIGAEIIKEFAENI